MLARQQSRGGREYSGLSSALLELEVLVEHVVDRLLDLAQPRFCDPLLFVECLQVSQRCFVLVPGVVQFVLDAVLVALEALVIL